MPIPRQRQRVVFSERRYNLQLRLGSGQPQRPLAGQRLRQADLELGCLELPRQDNQAKVSVVLVQPPPRVDLALLPLDQLVLSLGMGHLGYSYFYSCSLHKNDITRTSDQRTKINMGQTKIGRHGVGGISYWVYLVVFPWPDVGECWGEGNLV